jgi:DNA-binding transcriptional LysR family regulator
MKLNDLDLNKLHVFRMVAESASMREAGERLLRTPSAVSQSVTSLERALGLQLFTRAGIRLTLTDPGRKLLRQVEQNERSLQGVLDEVRGQPDTVRGRVTLGMPPGYPAVSLSKPLSAVLSACPELQLRLRFLQHAKLASELARGQLEMALSLQPLRRFDRRLRSQRLREETLILVVPPAFRRLCAGVLTELPVVDYYQKPLLIEGWLKHHRQKKVQTRIRVFASNLDHVVQLVLGGVGCAVVPRHVVEHELASGALLEHSWDKRRPWSVSVWLNVPRSMDRLSLGAQRLREALLT